MIQKEQFEPIIDAISEIKCIEEEIRKRKKGTKENFNFFSALVTDKQIHIEKYHTNFIAYLLDPNGSHDCDDLFLKQFLQIIQEKYNQDYSDIPLTEVTVTKNQQTSENRFIDILIEHKKEWVLFIENKVKSSESKNQLEDYYKFCNDEIKKKTIGVFLTKTGYKPVSIIGSDKIISLSYKHIIEWLQNCIYNELVEKHNIIHSIKQYILILKQILNIMDTEAMEEFKTYLDKRFVYLPTLETIEDFKVAIIKYSGEHEERKVFFDKVVQRLFSDLKGNKIDDFSFSFFNKISGKNYKIKISPSNNDNSDGGYGSWFSIHTEDDTFINWERIEINGIDDFRDVIAGTNEIIRVKDENSKVVEGVSEFIKEEIYKKIQKWHLDKLVSQ